MNKMYMLLLLVICSFQTTIAQTTDKEINKLIGLVRQLREPSEVNRKQVMQSLSEDKLWTQMDETRRQQQGLAKGLDAKKRFSINKMLRQAENNRENVSARGDMLNGELGYFNYSLYEQSVEKGQSITFNLKNRKGRQIFVVVPFDKNTQMSMTAKCNNKVLAECHNHNGQMIAEFDMLMTDGQTLDLSIKEEGRKTGQSFVILNFNSRKQ